VKRADVSLASTPTPVRGDSGDSKPSQKSGNQFFVMALNMSWQLAIVMLIPIIAGAQLDKHFDTSYLYTFVGLAFASAGAGVVMWRTLRVANDLPVAKLTAAQKQKIQKQYEEEDAEK
jgi:hypothetical protein